jgi:hypothetical protein
VAVFWPSGADRAKLAPLVLSWRQGVAEVHAATLLAALFLTFLAVRRPASDPSRILGPVATAGSE